MRHGKVLGEVSQLAHEIFFLLIVRWAIFSCMLLVPGPVSLLVATAITLLTPWKVSIRLAPLLFSSLTSLT
jgi:hypothetical protein